MKRYFIILILLLVVSFSFSQGQLTLQVVDKKEQPVEFAKLRLFSIKDSSVVKGGFANARGIIKIDKINYGTYYGVVTFFDFQPDTLPPLVFSQDNQRLQLGTVVLHKFTGMALDAVVIKSKEEKLSERSIDRRTYNVEKDMTSQGGSVVDILRNVPSVTVDNEGNVSLRGNGSVTILIDGRPSVLTSGDNGALNSIPASAIKKIEVVTNPSAKYNPDGTAGIINIVLKKQKLRGFNVVTQLTAASYNLYNGSLNFNYRNEKFNLFASYSFRYREGARNSFNQRHSLYNDTNEFLQQSRFGVGLRRSHTANIGADFFLTKNQTLGISASGSLGDRIRAGKQENNLSYNDELSYYWNRILDAPHSRKSMDINANYKLDFKDEKGKLQISATESFGDNIRHQFSNQYYFYPDGTPFLHNHWLQNQTQDGKDSRLTVRADLTRKINDKIKIETGLEAIIHSEQRGNYVEEMDTATGIVQPKVGVNNIFQFQENIFSAYGTFGHKVNNWFQYQVGIRLEQAYTTPYLVTTDQSFENNYFSFFPSAHLAFGTDSTGQFYGSYSRRINRPSMWRLNPFPMYRDPLNIRQGNPALQPEYINSYEIGYQKDWDKINFSGSVYFKETNNKIQRIRQFYDNQVSVSTFENIDKSYDYGAEIIISYSPFSWWRNMISGNAYERRVSANYKGTVLSNKGISWDVKWTSTFSFLNKTTAVQINARYYSKRYDVQGFYQFQPGVDLGLTRKLLDNNMTIGVRITDIFNQKGFRFEVNDRNRTQKSKFKWTTRRLYLTLSYKFGNLRMRNRNKELRQKIQESQQNID